MTSLERWTGDVIDLIDIRSRIGSAKMRELVDDLDYPVEIRESKTTEILNEYLEHADQPILGTEVCGELVGFVGLRLEPPSRAVIRHMAVHRGHRQQGIGKQMISEVCRGYRLRELDAETDCRCSGVLSEGRIQGSELW